MSLIFFSSYCQDVQRFKLGNARTFHYLNQSNCYELEGVDDSKEYIATRKAMDIVGISSDEQVLLSDNRRMCSLLAFKCPTKLHLPTFSFSFSGRNFSSCCCNSPSWKHWIQKGKGNRLIWTQRWKISVPSENCSWAFHVNNNLFSHMCIYTKVTIYTCMLSWEVNATWHWTSVQVWWEGTRRFPLQTYNCNPWWDHHKMPGSTFCNSE